MGKNKNQLSLEEKISRIQEIVDLLDSGDKPIEEMLKLYEEGMKLSSECRNFLENIEGKITEVTSKYAASDTVIND